MAQNAPSLNWGKIITQGVVAGIAGAILLALFLFVALVLPNHGTLGGLFMMDAANVGSTNPLVGLLAHLGVSIAWGLGYAYAAATRPEVNARPLISGAVFGVVVWLVMQFVLILGAVFHGITPMLFADEIVGHVVFFGIPVALTVRALSRN